MLSLRYTPKKQTNFNNSSLEKCSNELLSLPAAKYHINISCILFTFAKVQLCTKLQELASQKDRCICQRPGIVMAPTLARTSRRKE